MEGDGYLEIVLSLIGLALLILAHEFGHFITACFFGVRVEEFVIGLPGPKILKFKRNNTTYGVSIIPFGGYVRLYGEFYDPEKPRVSTDAESFLSKPWYAKVAIVAAGSIFNFFLAILLFAAMFMYGVPGQPTTTIEKVLPGSAAEAAGIKAGDKILMVDSIQVKEWKDVSNYISKNPGKKVEIKVERNGKTLTFTAQIEEKSDRGFLGIQAKTAVKRLSFLPAMVEGFKLTLALIKTFISYLISEIPRGTLLEQSSGPVGIFVETSRAVKIGFDFYLFLVGLISTNLGIVNLLPIPPLDGGRILLLTLEKTFRRKIPESVLAFVNLLGILIFVYLILYLIIADIKRYHLIGM